MYWSGSFGEMAPLLVLFIPIIAIVGGITAGIVKTLSRTHMMELAQRERIAAIERGIDPSRLPPLPGFPEDDLIRGVLSSGRASGTDSHHRSQALMIWGIVSLFGGIGISLFLKIINSGHEGNDANAWAIGIIPIATGCAFLLSARLTRPPNDGSGATGTPPAA